MEGGPVNDFNVQLKYLEIYLHSCMVDLSLPEFRKYMEELGRLSDEEVISIIRLSKRSDWEERPIYYSALVERYYND